MSSKTVVERMRGTLTDESGKTYQPLFIVTIRELYVDQLQQPASRAIAEIALAPMSNLVVPAGRYTLTLPFYGKVETQRVRVEDDTLLGGW